jgi:hypothetical protein
MVSDPAALMARLTEVVRPTPGDRVGDSDPALQSEPDGEQPLDDVVVRIPSDPVSVLDRDRGRAGQRGDDDLVVEGEILPVALPGQVQPSERLTPGPDRDAEKCSHRGMVRRGSRWTSGAGKDRSAVAACCPR